MQSAFVCTFVTKSTKSPAVAMQRTHAEYEQIGLVSCGAYVCRSAHTAPPCLAKINRRNIIFYKESSALHCTFWKYHINKTGIIIYEIFNLQHCME